MFKIVRFLKSAILLILFTASLNLSVQAAMPDIKTGIADNQSTLNELDFFLLPFKENESSQSFQPSVNLQVIQFSSAPNSIVLMNHYKIEMELFYRQFSSIFKEHPFIIIVRKLRI
ncbi:MAG TPA: hypothetical protein VK212_06150 [Lentimicrobium sp.]|nr:hypothetical protein [Lentimicrobium sp.]